MDQCVIRAATENDAKEVNDVSKYLGYSGLSDSESSAKLLELITSKYDEVYIAELSGEIVGWLHVFYARRLASENFLEIGGLVVHPDYRGPGIGKQLVQTVLSKYQGKLQVRCNETRVESHKFYEQLGFVGYKVQRVFEKRS